MDLRLKTVAKYVDGGSVCDIGCDHGKLCAELLIANRVKAAYGIDISEKALQKSVELKEKLGMGNLHLLVGNGFEPVVEKRIDWGVICGIGSNETIGIIKRQEEFAKALKGLILCPLKNTFTVREFLLKNGFLLKDEDLVFEKGRYYNIFVAAAGKAESFDDVDIYVGRRLIEKGHPLLAEWLKTRMAAIEASMAAYDRGVKTAREDKRNNLERMHKAYVRGLDLCRQKS